MYTKGIDAKNSVELIAINIS